MKVIRPYVGICSPPTGIGGTQLRLEPRTDYFVTTQLYGGTSSVSLLSILADVRAFILKENLIFFAPVLTGPALRGTEPVRMNRTQLQKIGVVIRVQGAKFHQTSFIVKQQQHFRVVGAQRSTT